MGLKSCSLLDLAKRHNVTVWHSSMPDSSMIPGFTTSINVYNWTRENIIASDRLGFPNVLSPIKDLKHFHYIDKFDYKRELVIVEYAVRFSDESFLDALKYFRDMADRNELARMIHEELSLLTRHRSSEIKVAVGVKLDEMRRMGGGVYIEEFGMLVKLEDARDVEHPESIDKLEEIRANRTVRQLADAAEDAVVTSIEAVDATGNKTISDRYISIHGSVYKVPIRYDADSKHHGVILKRRPTVQEVDKGCNPDVLLTEYLTFEEAETRVGLCRTIEDALAGGDRKLYNERALTEAQLVIKQLDSQINTLKRDHELEMLRLRAEYDREKLKQERERQEREEKLSRERFERERIRAEQENARSDARNFMEWIKLGAAIIGFFGIFASKLRVA